MNFTLISLRLSQRCRVFDIVLASLSNVLHSANSCFCVITDADNKFDARVIHTAVTHGYQNGTMTTTTTIV